MADSWSATAGWDLSWLQGALEEIVHIEAFILLGVFLALVMSWWDIRGRRMRYAMAAVAILTGLADEGFQEVFLSGAFRMLDVLWDLLAVLAGAGIFHFIRATNREEE
jgi:VanZ family protein